MDDAAIIGAVALGAGYGLSGFAGGIWTFALTQALLGFGGAATFGPLMSDTSHWFVRRRGIAVAIASCGNYLAGTIWPPIIQHFISTNGWRATQIGIGIVCIVIILPLALLLGLAYAARAHADASGVLLAVASGALTSGLGYVIWYAALRGLSALQAASVQLSVPVIAACGGTLWLDEAFTARLGVAVVAILGGIALVLTDRARKRG